MANASDNNEKEKQENSVDLEQLFNGSRVRYFWVIFRARLGMLITISALLAVFSLPTATIIGLFTMMRNGIIGNQPFSSNLGTGFPIILDPATRSYWYVFMQNFNMIIFVTASMPILLLGMAGAFYTVKFVARGQVVPVAKTFLIGIKKCFFPFLIASPVIAGIFFAITAGIIGFDYFWQDLVALKIILLILLGLMALVLMFMLFFYITMGVTYKLNPFRITVNSIKMAFNSKLLVRHFIILAISAVPITIAVLLFRMQLGIILGSLFTVILAFPIITLLWTLYADWVYKNVMAPTVAKKDWLQRTVDVKKKSVVVETVADDKIKEAVNSFDNFGSDFLPDDEDDNEDEMIEVKDGDIEVEERLEKQKNNNKKQNNKKYSFNKK
ncbi:MAG: hypothetical protein FWE13_01000 [Firmicutes bacterium]|nr:hypothetical protein [Bacillota bacterium]